MRIVVLGAAGFIGSRLVRALAHQFPDAEIVAIDMRRPAGAVDGMSNVTFAEGDLRDPDLIKRLFERPFDTVFHLAAALTVDAERDFERGMEINVHALIRLLEACRVQGNAPKFVFASSVSTFGGELPAVVDDYVHQNPQTSYGTHKLIAERLIDDYSRRGFLDGRSLRLPIVLTHPGPPTASVSDRIASLIREPLRGMPVSCPIAPETPLAVTSVDKVVAAMLRLHDVPAAALTHTRAMNLPALTVTPRQIADAVACKLPSDAPPSIEWKEDPAVQRAVESWPSRFASRRAVALGMEADGSIDEIIDAYLASV